MRGTSPLDRLPDPLDPRRLLRRGPQAARAAAAVTLVAALLRLLRLGHESLWLDEAASVSFVTREYTTLQLLVELPLSHTNPPLYFLLLDGWVALVGTGEAAIRFPSALLGILAVGLTYRLGARLYDTGAGLAASAILAVSSFHVHYSQEARAYSLLATLTLASYLLLHRTLERDGSTPRRRTLAGYVAATALLAYTHVYGFLVVLAQNLYVLPHLLSRTPTGDPDARLPLRSWVGLQAAVGALVTPYALALAARLGSLTAGEGTRIAWIPGTRLPDLAGLLRAYVVFPLGKRDLGVYGSALDAVSAGATLLLLALAALALTRPDPGRPDDGTGEDRTPMLLLWFLTPILGGYLLSQLVTPILQPHYTIPSAVALFLLAGAGASGLRSLPTPTAWTGSLGWHQLAAGLLLVAMVAPLPGYYAHDQKEQWREAVDAVEASASPGALVVVSETYTVKPYRYYADRADLDVVPLEDEAPPERVDAAARGHDEAWVVLSHARDDAIVDHLASADGNWTVADETAYVGIDVHELTRDR